MTITAIETQYAGCRFRSRLEARWAVFFDHLGIPWEYEPQGFQVPRGERDSPRVGYLPDFWLPRNGIWVEVKGALENADMPLLIGAAWDGDGLPRNPAGDSLDDDIATRREGNPAGNRNGPRLLILGSVPDPAGGNRHHVLIHHKGDISIGHATWSANSSLVYEYGPGPIASDSGDFYPLTCNPTTTCQLYWPHNHRPACNHPGVADAYHAARSARFEHGENGL